MRITITGSSGDIGRALVAGLSAAGHHVTGLDRRPSETEPPDRFVAADLLDAGALSSAVDGAGAVVHLAAIPHESDFAAAVDSHVRGTHAVLEAIRRHGVRRLVYASSNHAVGFAGPDGPVGDRLLPRPDTYYGWGKAAAEALCRLYHDRFGLVVACLRIGSFTEQPSNRRQLATWLSPADAVRLVDACLTAPHLAFTIAYGISANTRRWWDLGSAEALGYRPQDDSERYAPLVEATPESDDDRRDAKYVGGEFTRVPLGEWPA
jgi:uronate dehydrogenase